MPFDLLTKQAVMAQTWGHLAPDPGDLYYGHIRFIKECFHSSGPVIEGFEFENVCKGTQLNSSPWFYEQIHDFLWVLRRLPKVEDAPPTVVLFEFKGTYVMDSDDTHAFAFRGVVRRLHIEDDIAHWGDWFDVEHIDEGNGV